MNCGSSRAFAEALDRQDPLAHYRERFHVPHRENGAEMVYFCGHSLGLQPKAAAGWIDEVLRAWGTLGVGGHFEGSHPWFPYHEFATQKLARLVGALPAEVVAMNSLTVNLHLLMVSFYRPQGERRKILIEDHAFPSDRYAAESQLRFHGLDPRTSLLTISPRPGEALIRSDDLLAQIEREGEHIALVLLPGVQYYSGQVFDLKSVTEVAHRNGCVVAFDLAHAAGNLPLDLHEAGVDFAVWCSYKYLNAGPGAVAGCFVHERHGRRFDLPRFAGWWGHDKATRFEMPDRFAPLAGAEGWQLSNPPVLSLAPLLASLDLFDEAGMPALRRKAERLTAYLLQRAEARLGERAAVITPRPPSARGCQVSLKIEAPAAMDGQELQRRLGEQGFLCDFRAPDVIRVAPVPLYNRYTEVFDFVETLAGMV